MDQNAPATAVYKINSDCCTECRKTPLTVIF